MVEESIATRTGQRFNRLRNRYRRWAVKTGFYRKYSFALIISAVLVGIVTYGALSGFIQIGSDPANIFILLTFDLILLLLLSILVISRVVRVWVERRKGSAGSRLHIRLVALFAGVAAMPAIVLAVFSLLIFNLGIQAWFSDTVRTALDESNAVAEAYLKEHQQNIRADILSLARDINHEGVVAFGNQELLQRLINTYATLRSLSEVVVFEASGQVLAKAGSSFILQYEKAPPPWAFEKADEGDVAVLTSDRGDRVRGLLRLDRIQDTYLYVGRFVDHRVLEHMEKSQAAVKTYEQLEGRRSGIQLTFAMVFVVVALLLVLAAVWFGLVFATNLARPISQMIAASEKVRDGDLSARVDDSPRNDELGLLSRSFNRMTSQLQAQRSELMEVNRQLELRRRFTETVLSGVSAGVIGLDDKGAINLPNRSASELLSTDLEGFMGKSLRLAVPEMSDFLGEVMENPDRLAQAQIKLVREGRHHTLLVKIAAEKEKDGILGYVVTFDDVTDLVSAQRKAAWADVARRIAHEIKNPLTPIQLSAERLKRRYLKEITSDRETFQACIDTIVRQVGDIGRMVDEFSSFARMPQPVMKNHDLNKLCREAVVLQKSAFSHITFEIADRSDLPINSKSTPVMAYCDSGMLGQVLTNLLKNATESIDGRDEKSGESLEKGHIRITVGFSRGPDGEHPQIVIEDNGRGFPQDSREKLTEPYVTTREKGTGLGLAIVKKIMEDHYGRLILEDSPDGGARVRLILPQDEAPTKT